MRKCKYPGCNADETFFKITEIPNSVHYAEERCRKCNGFQRWVKNPETIGRTKTSRYKIKDILKFHNYKDEFCFFCLKIKEQLGKNETITIDHIQELDKGGEDKVENLQILCSACHKLKNWARLYTNWHLKNDTYSRTTQKRGV